MTLRKYEEIYSIQKYALSASSTVQEGDLCVMDTSNSITASVGVLSASAFVGVALDSQSTAGELVRVAKGLFFLPTVGISGDDVGSQVYVAGAALVTGSTAETGGSKAGTLLKKVSDTEVLVDMRDIK